MGDNRSLGFWAIGFLLLIGVANGSIHEYKNERFTVRANARFFHGGSEGLYASKFQDLNTTSSDVNPLKGKSFIRSVSLKSLDCVVLIDTHHYWIWTRIARDS